MAGRPRSFDKNKAVDRFVQIFWEKGFTQTSVDDLQATTGIQRGSFYAAFTDKDTAFLEALKHYSEDFTRQGLEALQLAKPENALACYIRFVGRFLAKQPGRGCFLLTTISQPPAIISPGKRKVLDSVINGLLGPLEEACVTAVGKENPDKAKLLYAFVLGQVLGLNALARSGEAQSVRKVACMAAELIEKEYTRGS